MSKKTPQFRLIIILLILLPAWIVASAAIALVKDFRDKKAALAEETARFAKSVSSTAIADDLHKFINIIGERNESKADKLSATVAMIRGLLGPGNTGYQVQTHPSPTTFPLIQVTISSKNPQAAPLWLMSSYDSPPGSRGAERNASGTSATLAAAQALADDKPERPIHFLFLPHANDPAAPCLETAIIASKIIQKQSTPKAILCIEAMGYAENLIVSSRDTAILPNNELKGLGEILGAEVICLADDFDLASRLFEMNLPAMRIATRTMLAPQESDEKVPFAPTVAASSARLIELTRRLAR